MINKSFIDLLRIIQKLKSNEFGKLVDYLDDKSIDHICECVFNVCNTDLKIPRSRLKKLKTHIHKNCNVKRIRSISTKKTPLLKRRKVLKQEGRGLPFLLATAIPFLTNLFTK